MYEQGRHIGHSNLTQGSAGLQAGGQTFSELLVFENQSALDRFKEGKLGARSRLRQPLKHRSSCLEIRRLMPFGEPSIQRGE